MVLFGPSGGLVYHARAMRDATSLWRPFHVAVRSWLARWQPTSQRLVLIGPSAGYSLDGAFLSRFARIVAIDTDPLAEALFRQRHREVDRLAARLQWLRVDHFAQCDLTGLKALLEVEPGSAVLFCNLLGQLHLVLRGDQSEQKLEFWRQAIPELLVGRPWASYHDRVSGPTPLDFEQPLTLPQRLDDQRLLDRFYAGHGGELIDHRTAGMFRADRVHDYMHWELTRGYWHLVEATCSNG
jgi:hypothetical protein